MDRTEPESFYGNDNLDLHEPSHGFPSLPPPRPMAAEPILDYKHPQNDWWKDLAINRPQLTSMAAALMVFISGGMNLAWSLGQGHQNFDVNESYLSHEQVCWFIAVIIGACLGTFFSEFLLKRTLNFLASGLVVINGILLLSASESLIAIIFARYLDGIAFGMTAITAIAAGSEQAIKRFRGIVMIHESLGIATGIMLKSIFTSSWRTTWSINSNQVQGIITVILGLLGLVFAAFLTIESAIFYLRWDREADAMESLIQLQTHRKETHEIYNLSYENKNLLKEDFERQRLKNIKFGYVPLAKLCFYRGCIALSFSIPLNWAYMLASGEVGEYDDGWSWYIYGIMRWMGVIVGLLNVDTLGRVKPTVMAMLAGGGLLIGVGSVLACSANIHDETKMRAVLCLLGVYQFLSGVAAPPSTVYLGEAFSFSVKPMFILATVFFENVIQIITCCVFGYNEQSAADFSFTMGSLQMVFATCFVMILPETKQTTLREALKKFRRILYIDLN